MVRRNLNFAVHNGFCQTLIEILQCEHLAKWIYTFGFLITKLCS